MMTFVVWYGETIGSRLLNAWTAFGWTAVLGLPFIHWPSERQVLYVQVNVCLICLALRKRSPLIIHKMLLVQAQNVRRRRRPWRNTQISASCRAIGFFYATFFRHEWWQWKGRRHTTRTSTGLQHQKTKHTTHQKKKTRTSPWIIRFSRDMKKDRNRESRRVFPLSSHGYYGIWWVGLTRARKRWPVCQEITHTHTHTPTHPHTHTPTHPHTHTPTHPHSHTYTHTPTHTHPHTPIHPYTHTHTVMCGAGSKSAEKDGQGMWRMNGWRVLVGLKKKCNRVWRCLVFLHLLLRTQKTVAAVEQTRRPRLTRHEELRGIFFLPFIDCKLLLFDKGIKKT